VKPTGETERDVTNLIPIGEGRLSSEAGSVTLISAPHQWAYSAEAEFKIPGIENGSRIITIGLEVESGVLGIGWLRQDQSAWTSRTNAVAAPGEKKISLVVPAQTYGGKLVFENWTEGGKSAIARILSITIIEHVERVPKGDHAAKDAERIERLWPLDHSVYNLPTLAKWSRAQLQAVFSGDPWQDNLVLNKWEFATGVSRMESYPWRFSVPFVLCNARCDFCAAWLVQGKPMPIDLLDRLDVVLPYLAEIDLVGWGEPLIHPEFEVILAKFRANADRRARIALTTNGVHLKKWVDRLIDANVKDVAISMHAASPRTHEDLMGLRAGAFHEVLQGIKGLTARKQAMPTLRIGLVFIVMRQNIGEISEFLDLAAQLNVDSVFLRTLKPRTREEQETNDLDYHRLPPYLHPDFERLRDRAIEAISKSQLEIEAAPETWSTRIFPAEFEEEILRAPLRSREQRRALMIRRVNPNAQGLPMGEPLDEDHCNKHDNGMTLEQLENPYDRTAPLYCPSPYTALYINGFDRNVNPCCYMLQVPGYKTSYLRKGASFDDVWNSPAMIELRRSLYEGPLKQPCLKCPFYW
jgi:MoaA/NifB/PqqE/SkfB family radical SAM enzyme